MADLLGILTDLVFAGVGKELGAPLKCLGNARGLKQDLLIGLGAGDGSEEGIPSESSQACTWDNHLGHLIILVPNLIFSWAVLEIGY